MIRVQDTALNPGVEINSFLEQNQNAGGVATFIGQVRDFQEDGSDRSPKVVSLNLEHYPGMTEKEMRRIADESCSRWPLDDVLVIHRFGKMAPGEAIVLVCTAATHRGDAFAACEFLMDWLKTKAPFWKREKTISGATWVEARISDATRAARWAGKD